MPIAPAVVSVTVPVSQAIERTKQLLFRPFNLDRWFIIGFCAWLATLGQGGFNFNYRFGRHYEAAQFRETFERVRGYVLDNLAWIVPVAIAAVLFLIALGVVMLWLRSRGQFMFLHCIALGKDEVGEPWRKFADAGNSLFRFRLVLALLGAVATLPLFVFIALPVVRMFRNGAPDVRNILTALAAGCVWVAVCIALGIVAKLTTDFVVPIMFLRRNRCVEAWQEFLCLLSVNLGNFVVYLLFQIVLGIAVGGIVLMAVLVTCCIAGCLMAIPYIGTVLLLPVLSFKRYYSLHYLAQYGADFDVFPPPPAPVPT